MAITVRLDARLAEKVAAPQELELDATTVHEALIALAQRYPALHLFNCEGELRALLRLTRAGQPISARDSLAEGDTLELGLSA